MSWPSTNPLLVRCRHLSTKGQFTIPAALMRYFSLTPGKSCPGIDRVGAGIQIKRMSRKEATRT